MRKGRREEGKERRRGIGIRIEKEEEEREMTENQKVRSREKPRALPSSRLKRGFPYEYGARVRRRFSHVS